MSDRTGLACVFPVRGQSDARCRVRRLFGRARSSKARLGGRRAQLTCNLWPCPTPPKAGWLARARIQKGQIAGLRVGLDIILPCSLFCEGSQSVGEYPHCRHQSRCSSKLALAERRCRIHFLKIPPIFSLDPISQARCETPRFFCQSVWVERKRTQPAKEGPGGRDGMGIFPFLRERMRDDYSRPTG